MLKVVGHSSPTVTATIHSGVEFTEAFGHHSALIGSYLQSHRIRNHSERTIQKESAFLKSWFEEYGSTETSTFQSQVQLASPEMKKPACYRRFITLETFTFPINLSSV